MTEHLTCLFLPLSTQLHLLPPFSAPLHSYPYHHTHHSHSCAPYKRHQELSFGKTRVNFVPCVWVLVIHTPLQPYHLHSCALYKRHKELSFGKTRVNFVSCVWVLVIHTPLQPYHLHSCSLFIPHEELSFGKIRVSE